MRILGISGLTQAVPFKKRRWPGQDEREYRISQGHDSAAALVTDGHLIGAAAEERFNLKKHTGDFPVGAINYCLAHEGVRLDQIDELVHAFDYTPYAQVYSLDPATKELYESVFSREALLEDVRRAYPEFPTEKVVQVPHHTAHAASAAFTSGWDDSLVIVIDAMGEAQSVTVYHAEPERLTKLKEISANDSIGIFYSLVTLHLGFDFNADEYKIMGLAPYGDPSRYRSFFREAIELREDGTIRIPALRLNKTREERENYLATRSFFSEKLIPARDPQAEITADHRNIAASLQEILNHAVQHVAGFFGRQTGLRKLAMAGGVALNCTANGKLMRSGLFDEIYVQPAAGDDGAALGAAVYRSWELGEMHNRRSPVPFYGPAYPETEIEQVFPEYKHAIEIRAFDRFEDLCQIAAELIGDGKVLAWYRGRMEFGPRALGNRSILADPGHPEMRDRINAMVKKREAFRPFAPAVTIEEIDRWFETAPGTDLPFMIATVNVRPEHRNLLPAITHIDGTARVQSVSASDNPDFHALLSAVGRVTGRQMVLNTSFNVKGQPMVNSPREALETFLGTGIEYLFIGNYQISKTA